METFESWTHALDEGYGIDVMYLDYLKAFDVVPHQRLIYKLSQLGITGKVLAWIKEFWNDRIMKVNVRGSCFQWAQVTDQRSSSRISLGTTALFVICE